MFEILVHPFAFDRNRLMQMEQAFLRILPGSRDSIVTPMFHDHFNLNATLYQKDKRVEPGNLQ
jgi:hypothetical protein